MMWYGGGGGWMFLWMFLFWGGVILLILWAVRLGSGGARASGPPGQQRAVEILEERYARGEIDRKEFEERRAVLDGR